MDDSEEDQRVFAEPVVSSRFWKFPTQAFHPRKLSVSSHSCRASAWNQMKGENGPCAGSCLALRAICATWARSIKFPSVSVVSVSVVAVSPSIGMKSPPQSPSVRRHGPAARDFQNL